MTNPLLTQDRTPADPTVAHRHVQQVVASAIARLPSELQDEFYFDESLSLDEHDAYETTLAPIRAKNSPHLGQLHADIIEWGNEYNALHPVTGRHDRACEKHEVCQVLTAYRRLVADYHSRAHTPPRDRDP